MEPRIFQLLELAKALKALASFAVSESGQEACLRQTPVADPIERRRRNDLIREGRALVVETGFALTAFPDVTGVFGFLENPRAVLDTDALWALQQVMGQARTARTAIGDLSETRFPNLLSTLGPWPQKSASALARCLASDGGLKDESSPELFSVRQEIRRIHQQCSRKVKDFVTTEGIGAYLMDDFVTVASDRYVLPLKASYKTKFHGIIHDYSQTGETCYFEPLFLVELNNRLQELKREEREAELAVLRFLTGLVREERPSLEAVCAWMVELDVLMAKVGLAGTHGCLPLDMEEGAPLHLRAARHPVLAFTGQRVTAIDIELHEDQRVLVISGGNAGGKTVTLKTLGLIALMCVCGLPVPADEGSTLPVFDDIFAFIGDEQSLEDHVSTFTAQIRHLSDAFGRIRPRTLVILDEFGAGTDPTQGAALAQAVLDELRERGAYVAAATHFPALKAYAMTRPGVRSASVLFDPKTKRPMFRLAYDQVGASLALDVAREHGLPETILKRAADYLLLDGTDSSLLMDRLNALAAQREKEIQELEEERHAYEKRRGQLALRYEREKTRLLDEVRRKSNEILRKWEDAKISRKQASKELSETRRVLTESEVEDKPRIETPQELDLAALRPGDAVRYVSWGKTAKTREVDVRRHMVKIDMDGVSMWVRAVELAPVAEAAPTVRPRTSAAVTAVTGEPRKGELRLDLRGQRADEAVARISKFIDDAVLGGFTELEILHGRGTGALRREVHDYLRHNPSVDSFRIAAEDYGGDGVTLVVLR